MQLPVEIWYRILLFTENPINLSKTQKKLYELFNTPVGLAQWLVHRFTLDEAILGALWSWNNNPVWRMWIKRASHSNLIPTSKYPRFDIDKTRNMLKTFKPCKKCRGQGITMHSKAESMNSRLNDIHPPLKQYTMKQLEEITCPIERKQWQILMLLFDYGADPFPYGNFLIRYSALSGHIFVLGLVLGKLGLYKPDKRLAFPSDIEAQRKVSSHVLKLLLDSIEKGNIMMLYQCIRTEILHRVTQTQWTKIILRSIKYGNLNTMSLILDAGPPAPFESLVQGLQLVASYKWCGYDRKKCYTQIGRFIFFSCDLDHLEEHQQQELLWRICELGDVSLASHCHSKNWNMNGFNNGNVVSAILYGHYPMVKYLIQECRCNPRIFNQGNLIMILIGFFNHLALLFSLISSVVALINGCYCQYAYNQAGNIQIFFFTGSSDGSLCYVSKDNMSWSFYFLPVVMFLVVYILLYRTMPLISLSKSCYICIKAIRQQRVIHPDRS